MESGNDTGRPQLALADGLAYAESFTAGTWLYYLAEGGHYLERCYVAHVFDDGMAAIIFGGMQGCYPGFYDQSGAGEFLQAEGYDEMVLNAAAALDVQDLIVRGEKLVADCIDKEKKEIASQLAEATALGRCPHGAPRYCRCAWCLLMGKEK